MELKEIGVNMRNWVDSAQERDYRITHLNAVLNPWVPYATELVNISSPCNYECNVLVRI